MNLTLKVAIASLGILSGCVAQKVTAVHVHVSGESFVGERYRKDLDLAWKDGRWVTDYTCTSRFKTCEGCANVKRKPVDSALSDAVVNALDNIVGIHGSPCCDHPFTELKIEFDDKSTKSTTIGFDLLAADNQRSIKEADRDAIRNFRSALCR